jgi:hypothetical protein
MKNQHEHSTKYMHMLLRAAALASHSTGWRAWSCACKYSTKQSKTKSSNLQTLSIRAALCQSALLSQSHAWLCRQHSTSAMMQLPLIHRCVTRGVCERHFLTRTSLEPEQPAQRAPVPAALHTELSPCASVPFTQSCHHAPVTRMALMLWLDW